MTSAFPTVPEAFAKGLRSGFAHSGRLSASYDYGREVKLLFEILEKRNEMRLSTFICSQRKPASWRSMILNDEVSANAILKRATKHYTVVIKPLLAIRLGGRGAVPQ